MAHDEYKDIGDPLDILAEECAEVIKILMKMKRFGVTNTDPVSGKSNIILLAEELEDVMLAIQKVDDKIQFGKHLS